MTALSNSVTGNEFVANLTRAGQIVTALPDSSRDKSKPWRQTVMVPLRSRERGRFHTKSMTAGSDDAPENNRTTSSAQSKRYGISSGANWFRPAVNNMSQPVELPCH